MITGFHNFLVYSKGTFSQVNYEGTLSQVNHMQNKVNLTCRAVIDSL
jgi:hypothetical protein